MNRLEPALRGVLLAGGAQLLFMDRLPKHAVVNESVKLAAAMVRPGAKGLVNAVLRRCGDLRGESETCDWLPDAGVLPVHDGVVRLNEKCLPDTHDLGRYLHVATGHPLNLVNDWLEQFDRDTTIALCHHGIINAPTIVAVELGFDETSNELWRSHDENGFVIWGGSHEQLVSFLAGHRDRRVQDPASSRAIGSTVELQPHIIIDYCAGRGTKTRQLAMHHSGAQVIATEIDSERIVDLRSSTESIDNIEVVEIDALKTKADLIVLDVPCSNTAVLARRPEARYRFNDQSIGSLLDKQRDIVEKILPLLADKGRILYSTCSLDDRENRQQAAWISGKTGGQIEREELTLPRSGASCYRDGSYYALIRT